MKFSILKLLFRDQTGPGGPSGTLPRLSSNNSFLNFELSLAWNLKDHQDHQDHQDRQVIQKHF